MPNFIQITASKSRTVCLPLLICSGGQSEVRKSLVFHVEHYLFDKGGGLK